MDLAGFCGALRKLGLGQTAQALAVLWFHDEKTPDIVMSGGQLAKIIFETGLGNPNSTRLGDSLRTSGRVIWSAGGFRLKALARSEIRDQLAPILGDSQPTVDQSLGYIPEDVWKNTRDYIEKVAVQINGSYQFRLYDGAAVLTRRLVETLIIEAYEHLKRESEIKSGDGNNLMLRDLVGRVTGTGGLNLGRDSKKALTDIKHLGDYSAHARRYNAVKADLDKVQMGVRLLVDELISIASLRRQRATGA